MFHTLKNLTHLVPKSTTRLNIVSNHFGFFKFHVKTVKETHQLTFERLDLDKDGLITEEDLKWTISTLGYGEGIIALMGYKNKDNLANTMMSALDKKGKGAVNLDSLVDFIMEKCPSEELVIQKFKNLDKNEDGLVSRDDLRQSLVAQYAKIPDMVLDDLVEKQMRLYDKNKDGCITMNEYISAWYYLNVIGALILRVPPERS